MKFKSYKSPGRYNFCLRRIELQLGRYFSISTKRWILIREPTRTCAFRSISIVASRAHGLFPRSEYKRTICSSFSSPAPLVRVSRCFATIYCRLADVPLAHVYFPTCLSKRRPSYWMENAGARVTGRKRLQSSCRRISLSSST